MDSKPLALDQQVALEQQRYMVKVYGWMCLALVITGFVAWFTATYTGLLDFMLATKWMFFALIIIQIVAVIVLVKLINRMSANVATIVFLLYSLLFGLTLSMIFYGYTTESIASTFLMTAGTFGVMSFYGYTTKTDLSKWGNLLLMALVALVITSLVNYFLASTTLHWITSCAGVVIFMGLTIYDTQKIKNLNIIGNEGSDEDHKEAISGALTLYLDFIALFLFLLTIFGRRR
jgi:FtsH-binding integral membrane protein